MIRVDLRSDTVSHPSPEMRKAMAEAELGDDVYGDDPTVNELQDMAAEKLGKEAGLFVSSGTQGNLVAMLAHCQRGDAVALGELSHIYNSEAGGTSVLGGIAMRILPNEKSGAISADAIRAAGEPGDYHKSPVKVFAFENTQNNAGGTAITPDETAVMVEAASSLGLKVHMDGARIWNSVVAQNVAATELTEGVDSITFCLSKGLACPIGSVLVGSKEFIEEADRWRKMLGGGMRQVGVVAAAGVVALNSMIDRMADDHANARKLAEGLAEYPDVEIDLESVQTNIVRFAVPSGVGHPFAAAMYEEGVYMNSGDSSLRFVPHYGIDSEDIDFTLLAVKKAMAAATS
jgi:threonine aldolase